MQDQDWNFLIRIIITDGVNGTGKRGQTFRIQRETGQIIRIQRNLSHVRVKSRDVFKVVQLTFLYVK